MGRKWLFNDSAISMRHYAFLFSEDEFDQVFSRIRDRWLMYWADPGKQCRQPICTTMAGECISTIPMVICLRS